MLDLLNRAFSHSRANLPTHVWGCTNPSMANYNQEANGDDGSCIAFDPQAVYVLNPSATQADTDHYNLVKGGIVSGFGSDVSGRIHQVADANSSLQTLDIITGTLAVRSLTQIENWVARAQAVYPDVLMCNALGSNLYIELTALSSIPVIVTTGGGDTQNRTAYGNALEFWDVATTSSEANGIVAGKLLYIKETLDCSWWEARYRARMTASNGGVWDKFNGYGKIDVSAAIAYAGTIITDPYL